MRVLVLSTFPEHGSHNVGDALITHSFEELVRHIDPGVELVKQFRGSPIVYSDIDAVFMPGFALRSNTWPNIYRLTANLDDLDVPLVGVGAGSKEPAQSMRHAHEVNLDDSTLALLRRVVRDSEAIACRDLFTQSLVSRFGLPTTLVGDCAMFDPNRIGENFSKPERIRRVAFTVPRHSYLEAAGVEILQMLSAEFPEAAVTVVRHGEPNPTEQAVEAFAADRGLPVVDVSGRDVTSLEVYDEFDMHVGFRVHAHLYRLRSRRPSLLVSEDSRGVGFDRTLGLIGVEPRPKPVRKRRVRPRLRAAAVAFERRGRASEAEQVQAALVRHRDTNYEEFDVVRRNIDYLFEHRMMPFVKSAISRVSRVERA